MLNSLSALSQAGGTVFLSLAGVGVFEASMSLRLDVEG